MQRLLTLSFAVLLGTADPHAGRAADPKLPSVSWAFDTRTDHDDTPHTRVFLRVGGRRVLVADGLTAQFSVLARTEYKERHIPAAAVTACSGWWAGQGEDLYTIRRHGYWEVFRRDLDEEAPIPAYRRVRRVKDAPHAPHILDTPPPLRL